MFADISQIKTSQLTNLRTVLLFAIPFTVLPLELFLNIDVTLQWCVPLKSYSKISEKKFQLF